MIESFVGCGNLLFVGQNHDASKVCLGGSRGFAIFNSFDFTLLYKEDVGAVSKVEMLFSSALVAFVGYGSGEVNFESKASAGLPPSSSKQLTMWNVEERKALCQLSFQSAIAAVKLNRKRLVVFLRSQKIHIFNLETMEILHTVENAGNPKGDMSLCHLCSSFDHGYLVRFPYCILNVL